MMLHNWESMKKFKDTVLGITGISDIYTFAERRRSSLSKPSDRPYHSFIYKIKGESEYFVGENTYELSAGEVIYLPKGCVYTVETTENGASYEDGGEWIAMIVVLVVVLVLVSGKRRGIFFLPYFGGFHSGHHHHHGGGFGGGFGGGGFGGGGGGFGGGGASR